MGLWMRRGRVSQGRRDLPGGCVKVHPCGVFSRLCTAQHAPMCTLVLLQMSLWLAFFNQAFASTSIINYAPAVRDYCCEGPGLRRCYAGSE